MVPLGNDLVEGFGLFLGEARQTEIIDDEQLRFEKQANGLLVGALHPRRCQSSEELGRRREQRCVTASASPVSQGLGQMGLAGAGRAIEDQMLFALDEEVDEP